MPKPLVILGTGGHGRVVAETAEAAGTPPCGFLDQTRAVGQRVNGLPVIGGEALLADREFLAGHRFIVAIGNQSARRRLSTQIAAAGGELATIRHPSCIVSRHAAIGAGSVLIAGAIVNANAAIGRFCILNTGCTVDHDVALGDGVQICPGAHLAGGVRCGEDAFIGTGAAIIPGVTLGARAVVGAGAVVIADVEADLTVVGVPARAIRQRAASLAPRAS